MVNFKDTIYSAHIFGCFQIHYRGVETKCLIEDKGNCADGIHKINLVDNTKYATVQVPRNHDEKFCLLFEF